MPGALVLSLLSGNCLLLKGFVANETMGGGGVMRGVGTKCRRYFVNITKYRISSLGGLGFLFDDQIFLQFLRRYRMGRFLICSQNLFHIITGFLIWRDALITFYRAFPGIVSGQY